MGLSSTIAVGPRQRSHSLYFTVIHLRLPQPEGPGSHVYIQYIYIPKEPGGPAIPSGNGFPFHPSYGLQGYSEGILTSFHMGFWSTANSQLTLSI
jgi:hypothetical protein